jgi:predicted nucleic acid-binding protein
MILIDSTPLVALCDARDSKHTTAVKHLESLANDQFVTCDAALTEACFHLPHRNQRHRLRALLHDLGMSAIPVTYDRGFWFEVLEWLAKYADHEPDWADGCLAVLSERDKELKVWTYDREFRTTWRRPNGTAIPLAVRWTPSR